jgi:hypothetical protein
LRAIEKRPDAGFNLALFFRPAERLPFLDQIAPLAMRTINESADDDGLALQLHADRAELPQEARYAADVGGCQR